MAVEYAFWICALLVAHTYVLYPIVLFVAYSMEQVRRDWRYLTTRCGRRQRPLRLEELPTVTLVVPAYNEEARVLSKIANVRELEYPREKLEVVFVSDGSTDDTPRIFNNPSVKATEDYISGRFG